jgi:hypothetical protein
MQNRCYNPKRKEYKNYGGRGIQVCERWMNIHHFLEDMGHPSAEQTIERKDNQGHYEPGNCYWADHKTQQRNRRNNRMLTYHGQTKCMAEWSDLLHISQSLIYSRLKAGWSVERTLETKPSGA